MCRNIEGKKIFFFKIPQKIMQSSFHWNFDLPVNTMSGPNPELVSLWTPESI